MSAESELRAVLTGHAPLIAQVPATRISIDAVLPTVAPPFIAFSKQQRSDELGLDGGLLAVQSTIDIQCVGSSRSNAIVVADLVRRAARSRHAQRSWKRRLRRRERPRGRDRHRRLVRRLGVCTDSKPTGRGRFFASEGVIS